MLLLHTGVRKEFDVEGRQVLMFWYRNEIYAIEARSPAEGAYSEGFIKAKFTQDFAIECPATGSTFSLKDGAIKEWYPNNPVLRALTPSNTCRNMDVYPVKLTQVGRGCWWG
jgi:nitrite reductase/ring-hydroxylating ferredoxin subunit